MKEDEICINNMFYNSIFIKKRVKKFNYFLYKYLNDYKEIIKSYKIYKKRHISILKLNF